MLCLSRVIYYFALYKYSFDSINIFITLTIIYKFLKEVMYKNKLIYNV